MSPDWTGERAARTEPSGLSTVADAHGWDEQPASGPEAVPVAAQPADPPTPAGPTPTPFDVLGPLPTGTTVLEASAGTGKTYTIAALAARYVAEGHVELDQLMMVTFGRMATDELRVRVRERLVRLEAQLSDALGRTPPGTPVPERDDVAHLLLAVDIAVEPFTRLAADHAPRGAHRTQRRGPVTRLVVVLAVDGFHHGVRHVERGDVHQLERADDEAGHVAQHAVDVVELGDAFRQDAQAFGAEAASGVVDDEARRVLRAHRGVAQAPAERQQVQRDGRVGQQPVDRLDHLHHRHRVEEVEAGHPRRQPQCGRDRGDRQRRGVAREHAVVAHQRLELGEQRLLGAEVLDDRLDDDIAVAQRLERGDRREARGGGCRLFGAQLAAFVQRAQRDGELLAARRRAALARIEDPHRQPGLRRDLHDAHAHHAGADHAESQRGGGETGLFIRGIGLHCGTPFFELETAGDCSRRRLRLSIKVSSRKSLIANLPGTLTIRDIYKILPFGDISFLSLIGYIHGFAGCHHRPTLTASSRLAQGAQTDAGRPRSAPRCQAIPHRRHRGRPGLRERVAAAQDALGARRADALAGIRWRRLGPHRQGPGHPAPSPDSCSEEVHWKLVMGQLTVWMNGELVGHWSVQRGTSTLTYASSWLQSDKVRSLSLSLPITGSREIRGPVVANWFDNLLPDNDRIRKRLSRRFRTKNAEAFTLLEALGMPFARDGRPGHFETLAGEPVPA
jgi:HipA-like protein